jgi:hypothetical protein
LLSQPVSWLSLPITALLAELSMLVSVWCWHPLNAESQWNQCVFHGNWSLPDMLWVKVSTCIWLLLFYQTNPHFWEFFAYWCWDLSSALLSPGFWCEVRYGGVRLIWRKFCVPG